MNKTLINKDFKRPLHLIANVSLKSIETPLLIFCKGKSHYFHRVENCFITDICGELVCLLAIARCGIAPDFGIYFSVKNLQVCYLSLIQGSIIMRDSF